MQRCSSPFRRNDPGPVDPGWIVTNVLVVAALELRHPVTLVVQVKSRDPAYDRHAPCA